MPIAQKTANNMVFRRFQANEPHPLTKRHAKEPPYGILTYPTLTPGKSRNSVSDLNLPQPGGYLTQDPRTIPLLTLSRVQSGDQNPVLYLT